MGPTDRRWEPIFMERRITRVFPLGRCRLPGSKLLLRDDESASIVRGDDTRRVRPEVCAARHILASKWITTFRYDVNKHRATIQLSVGTASPFGIDWVRALPNFGREQIW